MKKITLLFCALVVSFFVSAQSDILGEWVTIDDETNEPASIVKIYKAINGKYYGKILEVVYPGHENNVCEKCTGELKNKPLKGLIIIRDMEFVDGKLCNGNVLDPNKGKTYYAKIWWDAEKGKLILRGSLDKKGVFGRSQEWIRK